MENNNYAKSNIVTPLTKMGSDLTKCILLNANNNIDIKTSIQKYIDLLSSAINILHTIQENIPENHNFTLVCGSGYIALDGDRHILENLASLGCVTIVDAEVGEEVDSDE